MIMREAMEKADGTKVYTEFALSKYHILYNEGWIKNRDAYMIMCTPIYTQRERTLCCLAVPRSLYTISYTEEY